MRETVWPGKETLHSAAGTQERRAQSSSVAAAEKTPVVGDLQVFQFGLKESIAEKTEEGKGCTGSIMIQCARKLTQIRSHGPKAAEKHCHQIVWLEACYFKNKLQ